METVTNEAHQTRLRFTKGALLLILIGIILNDPLTFYLMAILLAIALISCILYMTITDIGKPENMKVWEILVCPYFTSLYEKIKIIYLETAEFVVALYESAFLGKISSQMINK